MASATAMTDCAILRIDNKAMIGALHRKHEFSDLFVAHLLARNIRYEEDLVDQLFNSSEKRLARILLLLAHFGKESTPQTVIPKISQDAGGNDRYHPLASQLLHEPLQEVGFYPLQWRSTGAQLAAECSAPRLSSPPPTPP